MSLSDFTPDTEEIIIKRAKKGDVAFEVRGLSFQDISKIVRVHYDDLEGLFDIYETHGGSDLSYVAMGKFAMGLINDAPGLVAHIIALAADDEANLEKAQRLPLTAQIDALKAIGRLTFSDVEDIKKMLRKAMDLMRDTKASRTPASTAKGKK